MQLIVTFFSKDVFGVVETDGEALGLGKDLGVAVVVGLGIKVAATLGTGVGFGVGVSDGNDDGDGDLLASWVCVVVVEFFGPTSAGWGEESEIKALEVIGLGETVGVAEAVGLGVTTGEFLRLSICVFSADICACVETARLVTLKISACVRSKATWQSFLSACSSGVVPAAYFWTHLNASNS